MSKTKAQRDPISESFADIEESAEFWDKVVYEVNH